MVYAMNTTGCEVLSQFPLNDSYNIMIIHLKHESWTAGVQPRWIQGDSKVGGRSRRLWKNTYLITYIERLEMDSVVGTLGEKRRLNNLDYVE